MAKAASQDHHRELVPLFRPYVPADAMVLDIGAHGGQFARLFASIAPQGRVLAFEPSSYARSVLAWALKSRGVRNVTVFPVALSDAEGVLTIATPLKRKSRSYGYGLAHVSREPIAANEAGESVRATTLDIFAREQNLARLDFIKIDIEGWERRFVEGAKETLSRFKPAVFMEIAHETLARANDTPDELIGAMRALGYACSFVGEHETLAQVERYQAPGDYLFIAA
ncbi:MAG: FkbM family methyltransferase [Hyphomonadaceae bacterium]